MEQLTLDFEYVINEVIRHDATWAHQFCSFSDYDIVILEVGPGREQGVPGASLPGITLNGCHSPTPPAPPRSARRPIKSSSTSACCSWRSRPQPRRASSGE